MAPATTPPFQKCVDVTNRVQAELDVLDADTTALERQWEKFRDDPARLSQTDEVWQAYLARLHEWYTVSLPREKAELLVRIDGYWQTEGGAEWMKMCHQLAVPGIQRAMIMSQLGSWIDNCNELWMAIGLRCRLAGQDYQNLRQLEGLGRRKYFVLPGPRELGLLPAPARYWDNC